MLQIGTRMPPSAHSIRHNQHEWKNWSGNQRSSPNCFATPGTEEELADVVARARPVVRVVGAGHSFSAIVPTNDTLISLDRLAGVISVDPFHRQATCWAGTSIREVGQPLHEQGLALINQGDVDSQTLAGAYQTGTHGTGLRFSCLATSIKGFRLITSNGTILDCDQQHHPEIFQAARVSLGTLGVISRLTLQCCDAYQLQENVFAMDYDECLARADELAEKHRHFEFFHLPFAEKVIVKTLDETTDPPGGAISGDKLEDVLFHLACHLTNTMPWLTPGLHHLTMATYRPRTRSNRSYLVFPSARGIRFNEMEYEVPAEAGVACFREIVNQIRRSRFKIFFPLEFRRVAEDDIWLSPFYKRPSVSISVHQDYRQPYKEAFANLEPIFWKYEGRPHWGKLHTLNANQFRECYPRWDDFITLRQEMDPDQKFLNQFLQKVMAPQNQQQPLQLNSPETRGL